MLGLAVGDALGAPHEGGMLERWLWHCLGRTRTGHMRYTDDTQMCRDLTEALLHHHGFIADAVAHREAASRAIESIGGDGGAVDQVGAAVADLDGHGPFVEVLERLRSVQAELTDAAAELRTTGEAIEDDDDLRAWVELAERWVSAMPPK